METLETPAFTCRNILSDDSTHLLEEVDPEETSNDLVISFIDGISPDTENIWINSTMSHSQAFEHKYNEHKKVENIKEHVPPEYHEYLSVFDEKKASRLPNNCEWDHKIDLKPGFVPKSSKVYPLTPEEDKLVKSFIDENLAKGYIRPSESPQASGFFFVAKKDS